MRGGSGVLAMFAGAPLFGVGGRGRARHPRSLPRPIRQCEAASAVYGLTRHTRSYAVSHYPLDELVSRWRREELTPEQMIGQLLLLLRAYEDRLKALERRLPTPAPAGK